MVPGRAITKQEAGATQAIWYSGAATGLASWRQVRPPSAVASRVPASPTAKHRDAVRQPTSYRAFVVPLCSAYQVPDPGAATVPGVPVAPQLAAKASARAASAVFMTSMSDSLGVRWPYLEFRPVSQPPRYSRTRAGGW